MPTGAIICGFRSLKLHFEQLLWSLANGSIWPSSVHQLLPKLPFQTMRPRCGNARVMTISLRCALDTKLRLSLVYGSRHGWVEAGRVSSKAKPAQPLMANNSMNATAIEVAPLKAAYTSGAAVMPT
jgi:hypothetical protein